MEINNLYEVLGFIFSDKKKAEYFIELVEGKNFDDKQLKEIHSGVEHNLVVDYANETYDSEKMEVIKNALFYGVKIDYGFEVPSFVFSEKVIDGFKQKVNIIPILLKYPKLEPNKIDILIYGLTLNIPNIRFYINEDFDSNQLYEIFSGFEQNVDISIYSKPEFDWKQMETFRLDLVQKKKNT